MSALCIKQLDVNESYEPGAYAPAVCRGEIRPQAQATEAAAHDA